MNRIVKFAALFLLGPIIAGLLVVVGFSMFWQLGPLEGVGSEGFGLALVMVAPILLFAFAYGAYHATSRTGLRLAAGLELFVAAALAVTVIAGAVMVWSDQRAAADELAARAGVNKRFTGQYLDARARAQSGETTVYPVGAYGVGPHVAVDVFVVNGDLPRAPGQFSSSSGGSVGVIPLHPTAMVESTLVIDPAVRRYLVYGSGLAAGEIIETPRGPVTIPELQPAPYAVRALRHFQE